MQSQAFPLQCIGMDIDFSRAKQLPVLPMSTYSGKKLVYIALGCCIMEVRATPFRKKGAGQQKVKEYVALSLGNWSYGSGIISLEI